MSAFNPDEHLAEIFDVAIKVAPMCTNGIDFSNRGGESRYSHDGKSDMEIVADRAWEVGEAFVAKYHAELEAVSERHAKAEAENQKVRGKAKKVEEAVTHG
jgi:hypothetical protein